VHRRELPSLLFVLAALFGLISIPAAVIAALSKRNVPAGIIQVTFGTIGISTFCTILAASFFALALLLMGAGFYLAAGKKFKFLKEATTRKADGGFDDNWEDTEMAVTMMGANTVKKKKRLAEQFATDMMHRTPILILEGGSLQEAFIKYDPEGLQAIYRIKKAPRGVASNNKNFLFLTIM
jgi:hypothetical protein